MDGTVSGSRRRTRRELLKMAPLAAGGLLLNASSREWLLDDGLRAADAASALAVEERYAFGLLSRTPLRRFAPVLGRPQTDARIWRLQGETRSEVARSRLETGCSAVSDGLVCTAYDGSRTHVVSIALQTGALAPIARLDGRFWATDAAEGWITGWLESTPAAIRVATREAFRPPRVGDEFPTIVSAGRAVMGIVSSTDDGSRLRVYPLCATGTCGG